MKKMCKVIFIILIQLILIYNYGCFKTTPIRNKHLKYLTGVVAHICDQTGWNSMENDLLIWNSKNIGRIKELLNHKFDKDNFLYIFSYIVNIFNYKYIGILQTFVEHVNILIEECEKYLTAKSFDNFINCTTLLEIGMKKSTVMFDSIYQVMWFLSYLDVQRVFVKVAGNPYTVVDEVYLVKQFIDSIQIKDETGLANIQEEYMAKVNEAVLVIFNTKVLIKNVTKRAISVLNEIRKLLIIPQRLDLKLNYEREYHSQECIENDFFNFVLNNLNKFYTHTKKIYYDDFNFDILLNPDAYNMEKLIPPLEEPLPLLTEVTTLKILVDEGKWKTVDHISIIHKGLNISANRIVRDPVSVHGFNLKKNYILQLLKCRFYEIFSCYYSYFTSIIQFCYNKKTKVVRSSEQNILTYINCINNLFETSKSSEYFFNKIFSVVKRLKDVSIWEVSSVRMSLPSIEKFLELFINTFNDNYLYEDVFNKNTEPFPIIKAHKYLKNMIHKRTMFKAELHETSRHSRIIRCQYTEKSRPFVSILEEIFEKNDDLMKINTIDDHLNACIKLSTFCINIIDIDFKDMGFDKIL
ncbi:uncharacterized protein LOC126906669 [Daktulosphaira vitifoliae]|uniref:uncharacterized protein LOC126906669 n=1 Tax=Daktulosphaira vitifoliae TaxID=58002 RepID=UPI0021AA51E6|nr:uncharacterized protein LOC126906669 [Daktulosphaira vitifoliae]